MGDAIFTRRFSLGETFIPFYELSINPTTIDATLTNFPVMVRTTSTNYNMSLFTDSNVYFTDESKTLLDFEVEYSTTNERVYHVKLPSISSSTATKFRLYFNSSEYTTGLNRFQVWDNNYLMVQHMGSLLTDSSGNNNNGTNSNTGIVTGLKGQARSFTTNGNHIEFPKLNAIGSTSNTTIFLTKLNSINRRHTLIGTYNGSGLNYEISGNNTMRLWWNGNPDASSTSTVGITDWQLLTFVRDTNTNNMRFFQNGNAIGSPSNAGNNLSTIPGINTFRAGRDDRTDTIELVGNLNEIRISNTRRENAWIKAEYHTLFNTMINNVTLTED